MCRKEVPGESEQHDQGIAQDALELRPPAVTPDREHGRDDAFGQQFAVLGMHIGKQIEGDGMLAVGQVEEAHLVAAGRRYQRQALVGQRAVRIDQQQAIAAGDVLADHRPQQGGLAHAGLAENGDLAQALMQLQGDGIAGGIEPKSRVFHIWASTGERREAPSRRHRFVGSSLMQVLCQTCNAAHPDRSSSVCRGRRS